MSTRVLLVDDEEGLRRNFRALLEDAGFIVYESANGAEGFAKYQSEQPDLVLTDLRMRSAKDGLGLVAAIHERDDSVPIIVVSGSGTLHDAVDAIRLGAWDYLVKPVQLGEELLVAIGRNLERARLLRENRRYHAQLEQMVAERTASLLASREENQALQARLMQAQKLESLGLLVGGIAHDFNNLIQLIRFGFAEIRETPPSGGEDSIATIDRALDQAAELIQQIFVFAGRGPANPISCDLADVVSRMEKLLRSAATASVELVLTLESVPSISADPTQLRQVIMNLVLNAAQAMSGNGKLRLGVGLRQLGPGPSEFAFLTGPVALGEYVTLCVEDSGSGMDEATLGRLGDPFFTTKASGHGLGLTTVIGIVRGLRGALGVTSVVGRGTRFLAAFPTLPNVRSDHPLPSILSRG
ncbi:MAG TPA: response regulator [Polyangiaceae bacterium]|nr:response regulator [Polyangiaceae bacterium]